MIDPAKERKNVLNLVDEMMDSDTPISHRRLPMGKRKYAGRNTRLPANVWFASIFELNEFRSATKQYSKVLNDRQILHNWMLEFGNKTVKAGTLTPGGAMLSGKKTVGTYRRSYRRGNIYVGQVRFPLLSLRYDSNQVAMKDGKTQRKYLTFQDCRDMCMEYKIADPRFFTIEEIRGITNHSFQVGDSVLWIFPTKKQYEELDSRSPGGIYKSIRLFENYYWKSDYEVPKDWSPDED